MALRFHSKAGADVLMLDADAGRVLQALGREPAAQGIFLPEQIEEALSRFASRPEEPSVATGAETDDEEQEPLPDLSRRAWPLLELLRAAQARGVPVTWSKP